MNLAFGHTSAAVRLHSPRSAPTSRIVAGEKPTWAATRSDPSREHRSLASPGASRRTSTPHTAAKRFRVLLAVLLMLALSSEPTVRQHSHRDVCEVRNDATLCPFG